LGGELGLHEHHRERHGTIRCVCRNVKYWRSASMGLGGRRDGGFRRLKARNRLPLLKAALRARKAKAAPANEHVAQTAMAE